MKHEQQLVPPQVDEGPIYMGHQLWQELQLIVQSERGRGDPVVEGPHGLGDLPVVTLKGGQIIIMICPYDTSVYPRDHPHPPRGP